MYAWQIWSSTQISANLLTVVEDSWHPIHLRSLRQMGRHLLYTETSRVFDSLREYHFDVIANQQVL